MRENWFPSRDLTGRRSLTARSLRPSLVAARILAPDLSSLAPHPSFVPTVKNMGQNSKVVAPTTSRNWLATSDLQNPFDPKEANKVPMNRFRHMGTFELSKST